MNEEDRLTIAIESAVLGGSCCLTRGSEIIAEKRGSGGVSRAEDLLTDIDSLLRIEGIAPTEISNFIVSAGPGSFTGIRIGIATALGFAAGLGMVPIQISLLDAIALTCLTDESTVVAVPAGRGMAHFAVVKKSDTDLIYTTQPSAAKIDDLLNDSSYVRMSVFDGHFDDSILRSSPIEISVLKETPAAILAAAAFDKRVRRDMEPLLIAKA